MAWVKPPLKRPDGVLLIKSGQICSMAKTSANYRSKPAQAWRMPQGRDIFSTLTVEENILIGMASLKAAKPKKSQTI